MYIGLVFYYIYACMHSCSENLASLFSATSEPWVHVYEYEMTAMTGYRLLSHIYNLFYWIACQ